MTASSAASAASATASKLASDAKQGISNLSTFGITIAVLVTVLAIVAAGVYFAGYADDIARWGAKKYYVGKARAEAEALGKVGGERAGGFLKGGSAAIVLDSVLLNLFFLGRPELCKLDLSSGRGAGSISLTSFCCCRFIEEEPRYGRGRVGAGFPRAGR